MNKWCFGIELPTAGKSVTGWSAIVMGALFGGVPFAVIASVVFDNTGKAMPFAAILFALFAFAGAWVGMKCHTFVRKKLFRVDEPFQRNDQ
jgi:hypothetical protein